MPIIEEILPEEEASNLKEKGNNEFRRGDHAAAEVTFSLALAVDGLQDKTLRGTLHCNRAQVRLKLFDAIGALDDAETALRLGVSYDKAAFRKARAQFLLARYEESAASFQKLKDDSSDAVMRKHASEEEAIARARAREHSSGEFDLAHLIDLDLGIGAEVAEFVGPIRVDHVPGKGRGIVVTRDVPAGELLFANRAFVLAKRSSLVDAAVEKLRTCTQAEHRSFFLLSDGKSTPEELPSLTCPTKQKKYHDRDIDKAKVRSILCANAHELDARSLNGSVESDLSGLFLIASLVNHSCLPSATRNFFGDMMFVRAARSLFRGEEVTDGYISVLHPSFERRSMLRDRYSFEVCGDRAFVEDALFPETLVKPILTRCDSLADLDGFQCLAAEVQQLARDRVVWLGTDAPNAVKAAACRLTPGLEYVLCSSLMAVFIGVAVLCKSSGRFIEAAVAYALCCRFIEDAAPHNAYHVDWALDAMSCAASGNYKVTQFEEYARKVVRIHFGPNMFWRVLRKKGFASKSATIEQIGERALPPGSLQYSLSRQANSVQLMVSCDDAKPEEVEICVSSHVVRIKYLDRLAVIVLPCSVIVEEAAPVRFLKKRQQLRLDLPFSEGEVEN